MSSGKELAREFRELKDDLEENTSQATEEGLETTQNRTDRLIRMKNIQYQGDLRRSGRVEPREDGGHVLKYGGTQAPHAAVVAMGTGPQFRPPNTEDSFGPYPAPSGVSPELRNSIDNWIKMKGIQAHSVPQEDLDWAIAASIVRNGTPRQPFLLPAWRSSKDELIKKNRRAIRKSVESM